MCKLTALGVGLVALGLTATVWGAQQRGIWTAQWKDDGVVAGTVKRICSWGLQPMMSPDGTKVAFWGKEPGDTTHDIFVANVDGSGIINLSRDANNTSNNDEPFWTPEALCECVMSGERSPDG